jgi:hypothetical protein
MKLILLSSLFLTGCVFSAVPAPVPSPSAPTPAGNVEVLQGGGEHPAGAVYQETESLPVQYTVIAEHLNIRAAASWLSQPVGWLDAGDVVAVREINDGWGFIGSGWVSMRYLVLDE